MVSCAMQDRILARVCSPPSKEHCSKDAPGAEVSDSERQMVQRARLSRSLKSGHPEGRLRRDLQLEILLARPRLRLETMPPPLTDVDEANQLPPPPCPAAAFLELPGPDDYTRL